MKKFYFLILFMCLAIGNAWAADGNGFEIFGKEPRVTSFATWNVSDFVSGATGTFSYDPSTKTLTFNNVSVSGIDKKVVYNKSVDGLTIVFKGECTFYSTDNILRYEMATILDGSASTKVEMHVLKKTIGDDKETFYSNNEYNTGTHDPYASLEIKNFPYLRLTAAGDYCISHTYGAVYIIDSHVLMESGKGTIHTNSYALGWFSGVKLTDCYYADNYCRLYTDGSYDVATMTSADKAERVKKCTILRDSEYSGVRLDGVAVLSTDSRWNASSKTLTLNANVSGSSYTYPAGITVEKPGITINGGGKTCSGYKYGLDYGNIGTSSAPTTIRNIGLTGPTAGIYGTSGYINIGDDVTVLGVDYAVNGGYVTFCPTANKFVNLQPYVTANWPYMMFAKKAILVRKLKLQDCEVYMPQGGAVNDTTIVGTGYTGQTMIRGWVKYDLYVNGTQVNENNMNNLTSLLGSSATGTLKYNPSSNTLTMTNLKAAPSSSETKGTLINSEYGSPTIAVEGVNEITANSNSSYMMFARGGITITKGNNTQYKLTLKGNPKYSFIRTTTPTIKDVSLYIDGQTEDAGIVNYSANASGTISNATVSIKCGTKPLSGMWTTSGACGDPLNSDRVITINPSTHQLVYCDETGPTNDVVTEDIAIYPFSSYTMTVGGSKPQSYSSTASVCFDEFSRRLYLRSANCGRIVSSMGKLRIVSIGSCKVTCTDNYALDANIWQTLTFSGPGSLTLTGPDNDYAAARIVGVDPNLTPCYVYVQNTVLKMTGKNGMIYTPAPSPTGYFIVTNSTVEAHCPVGAGFPLFYFAALSLKDCKLYVPQGGFYNGGLLYNADGTPAYDMVILTEAPASLAFDTQGFNSSTVIDKDGQYKNVSINNLRLKAGGYWSTICLPFDLKLPGSVLKDCDVRELTSMTKRNDKTIALDFTKRTLEMKHDTPYLIRNTGSTDIDNLDVGVVKIETEDGTPKAVTIDGVIRFCGDYDWWIWNSSTYPNMYALEDNQDNPVLVHKQEYTRDAFSGMFFLEPEDAEFYVIYTGTEDALIDGISLTPALSEGEGDWYSLDGSKLSGKPAKAGIYIQNGKKVVVK